MWKLFIFSRIKSKIKTPLDKDAKNEKKLRSVMQQQIKRASYRERGFFPIIFSQFKFDSIMFS